MVGTWAGRKRGRLVAQAFRDAVAPALPTAELWLVAEDVPAGAPTWLRSFGRVSDHALRELYRRAWVFALPSSYEGFGIPYVEAMASGLPVVATANPGARYVTDDGRAGRLVRDEQLGSALLGLLRDTGERERLATAGLARSRDFSLDSVVDSYERLYREVLGR
jgi:glycosyltransferase involved in cell wall biosynthesis